VQYFDRPGAFIQGDWNDYVPKDLPAAEAMELRAEAERLYGGKWEFRTVASMSPKRNDVLHAVCVTAKKAGIKLPNLATAPMSALKLAGSYVARATNHGNRMPAVNGTLSKDRQGRLVVRMGGAR
jgi:hypothetical protein